MLRFVDRPLLPPLTPGQSALPAFLAIEAWADERLSAERADAARRLDDARQQAERIRVETEARLRQAVLDGEREASRTAADRARDRLSAARQGVQRWIERAEQETEGLTREALSRLVQE